MDNHFHIIPHKLLSPGATINQSCQPDTTPVLLEENANVVMTDLRHSRPFSITATASIDETNNKMIACGVRLLFVAEPDGILQGLITYTDLFGEKVVQYIQEHGGTRQEILAQDIMTPLLKLEVLQRADIASAKVGDILDTIKAHGRQHMLVISQAENGAQLIDGLFSASHLEKLLDIKIELSNRANSFADLERKLN